MRSLRYFLLAAVFVAATPLAEAQIIPKFGVAGGLNFGSLSDAAGADFESSTGYHVGVFSDVGFGPLAARVSVLYVKAGDVGEGDNDSSISFIGVPVDFKFRFPTPVLKPYALLGPEARFALGDLADADARSVNLALNAGIGAEISALVGPSAFAELRYSFDASGFAPGDLGDDVDFKVSVFYLRVGVAL